MFFDEEPGGGTFPDFVRTGPPSHFLVNYYFLRKLGQRGWDFIGESADWLNMWEVECPINRLHGAGTYAVRAVMTGEIEDKLFFGENVVFFDVEGDTVQQQARIKDGVFPCSATLHIKQGKAVVVLNSMFDLPAGTTIPLYRPNTICGLSWLESMRPRSGTATRSFDRFRLSLGCSGPGLPHDKTSASHPPPTSGS